MRCTFTTPAILLLATALLIACDSGTVGDAPVEFAFDKAAAAEGIWEGTVALDGADYGQLRTELVHAEQAGNILNVDFDWIINGTPNGARDFTARLSGTLNLDTGQALMEGPITVGWRQGAWVHEQGQLVDPDEMRFEGTIRVMPVDA